MNAREEKMPIKKKLSYLLHYNDEELWRQVKICAARRSVSVKELILKSLKEEIKK